MGKRLVEDCLALDLAWLMRLAPIREGQSGNGGIKFAVDGKAIDSLRFRLDLREVENARLVLLYFPAGPGSERKPTRQVIELSTILQNFGGRRWWMRCPVTGERIRILYRPLGSNRFASRTAWGLAYRVERLNRFDRPFEKLFRVQRRLGNAQGLAMGLERPKGMWRRTFARHVERFGVLDMDCAEKIAKLAGTRSGT